MAAHRRLNIAPLGVVLLVLGALATSVAERSSARNTVPCGVPRGRTKTVVGGQTAQPHEFPWQVLYTELVPAKPHPLVKTCGGALIDDQWVLTAAHCVDKRFSATVQLGKHNRSVFEEGEITQNVSVSVPHPLFNVSVRGDYDVALVKLDKPVDFAKHPNIAPICLPSKGDFNAFDNKICTASGWGRVTHGETVEHAEVLQKIPVRVVPFGTCLRRRALSGRPVTRRMLCASATVQGEVCDGDSGGPLQCLRNGRYVLAGDVSFGTCGQSSLPTVYGRVSELLVWINAVRSNYRSA